MHPAHGDLPPLRGIRWTPKRLQPEPNQVLIASQQFQWCYHHAHHMGAVASRAVGQHLGALRPPGVMSSILEVVRVSQGCFGAEGAGADRRRCG
eukprot:12822543-Alexandrium_andersonii.AAC.1